MREDQSNGALIEIVRHVLHAHKVFIMDWVDHGYGVSFQFNSKKDGERAQKYCGGELSAHREGRYVTYDLYFDVERN